MEFKPWETYDDVEPQKIEVAGPPCLDCQAWNPEVVFKKSFTGQKFSGIILCHAMNMHHDFSCFHAQEICEVPNKGGSVWVDPKTDLEWQCASPGEMSWDEAMRYSKNLGDGWRLSTIEELETLLDRPKFDSAMRAEVPFRDSLSYWSSTINKKEAHSAWYIYFLGSGGAGYSLKSDNYRVRCVRIFDVAEKTGVGCGK